MRCEQGARDQWAGSLGEVIGAAVWVRGAKASCFRAPKPALPTEHALTRGGRCCHGRTGLQ